MTDKDQRFRMWSGLSRKSHKMSREQDANLIKKRRVSMLVYTPGTARRKAAPLDKTLDPMESPHQKSDQNGA